MTIMATEEADSHSLSDAPSRDTGANRFDTPRRLVPRHSGKAETWKQRRDSVRVGMTDSARFNPDQNLSLARLGNWSFNNPKATGRRDFDCLVCFRHIVPSSEYDLSLVVD
jgi:hypothetical protein